MKALIPTLISVLVGFGMTGCTQRMATVRYGGETMGTTYQITAGVPQDLTPPTESDVDYVLYDINQSLSPYIASSLVSEINASADTSALHRLDLHFLAVFRKAKEISDATGGAFNPAVGPLVRAWGFGNDDPWDPDSSQVAELQALTDFSAFRIVPGNPPRLKKRLAGGELDFNAIAKGYAVDELGRLLEGSGIDNYLVEIGGEIRARGRHPDGRTWRIGIEKPLEAARDIQAIVELTDVSMATSGNYRNYYLRDGRKFVHTINPTTGYPEMNRLLSATVIAPDCMTADAYATALMVMGPDKAKEFATTPNVPDMYLIIGGDSTAFEVFSTSGMDRFLSTIPDQP